MLPVTTILPAFMAWMFPGAQWFYEELIPSGASRLPYGHFAPRASMAICQLANCSFFGKISGLHINVKYYFARLHADWINFVFGLSSYQGRSVI